MRGWLDRHGNAFPDAGEVCVGLSGGADSLALTAAAVAEFDTVRALVVDHRLQAGSDRVAARAARQAVDLGCGDAEVLAVDVHGAGGMEAAARRARYPALARARGGAPVLLAHTLDDQAETVLLGLARGSGPRSIRGMSEFDAPWGRPLLGLRREVTRRACVELGLDPHEDPHNRDPAFTRVRLRTEVLPLLEEVLGGGVAPALARTATQLQEDGAVLDRAAAACLDRARAADGTLDVAVLGEVEAPVVRRVLREWLLGGGARELTDSHLRAVADLVVRWRGQGPVALPGGGPGARLVASRRRGRLNLGTEG
ncbi:tRNA lysidine(34) synthetase TilS [Corynebacteriales bacterium D3-21]|uniref:tRNA(Ile)-lysidine synthase n=1 Tax=Speluncibacter jeojiensis TaxID=2710754 RepID=A0A9X4M4L4_9ACTN|nr:tRNA lysidine(34) synthetase TilS [Rhodococcus sp. D2-41]MDG3016900.1 tRNA lysidine(34) synthetase TilS [Corynebacteriales bacterium D3-21]